MKKYFLLTLLGGMTMQCMASGMFQNPYFNSDYWKRGLVQFSVSPEEPINARISPNTENMLAWNLPPIKAFDAVDPEQYASVCDRSTGVFEALKKNIPDLEWRDVADQHVIRSDEPLVLLNGKQWRQMDSPYITFGHVLVNVEHLVLPNGGLSNKEMNPLLVEAIAAGVPFYIDGVIDKAGKNTNVQIHNIKPLVLKRPLVI